VFTEGHDEDFTFGQISYSYLTKKHEQIMKEESFIRDKDSCDLTSESCVSVVAMSERIDHSENLTSSSIVHLDALESS